MRQLRSQMNQVVETLLHRRISACAPCVFLESLDQRGIEDILYLPHRHRKRKAGRLTSALSTNLPLPDDRQGGVSAEFVLAEGKSPVFLLRDDCDEGGLPCMGPNKGLRHCCINCEILAGLALRMHLPRPVERWNDQVQRSALALPLHGRLHLLWYRASSRRRGVGIKNAGSANSRLFPRG